MHIAVTSTICAEVKFNNGKQATKVTALSLVKKDFQKPRWRTQHSVDRNGDIYPTHGLGPVAHWLDI